MKKIFALTAVLLAGAVALFASEAALTLADAQKLAVKAGKFAEQNGWHVSVAVVNSEGNLIYFQRGDGAFPGSIEAAIDKARGANAFNVSTRYFSDNAKKGQLGDTTLKNIVAVEGGEPIIIGGVRVGAVGVSGASAAQDGQCALAALK